MNRARLNHILIPSTFEGRERFRKSLFGRLLAPLGWIFGALSEEGRIATLLLLFVGTAALDVVATPIYLLWCALAGIVSGSLVARWAMRLRKVRVEVRVGRRVTVNQPLTMEVVLHNDGPHDVHALRVSGPFLPWDGQWLERAGRIATLRAGQRVRIAVKARFIQRGPHHLDRFSAAALVPLGLALGPQVQSDSVRFLVVPRVARVESLEMPQGAGRYQRGGVARASRVGEALELFGVRPYRAGDAMRDLHPRTWARTGKPHVREYVQEHFTRVAVLVDNSREDMDERTFEALLSLAAGVVARLCRGEALIDLLLVGEQLRTFTIGRSLGTLGEALDMLAAAEWQPHVSDAVLFKRIEPHLANVGGVFVLSAADREGLAEQLRRAGSSPRLLQIYSDRPSLWQRRKPTPAANSAERVPLSHIEQNQSLRL